MLRGLISADTVVSMKKLIPVPKVSPGRSAQFAIDLMIMSGMYVLAYLLRFEFAIPRPMANDMFQQLPFVVGLHWCLLVLLGAYRRIWRFISLVDIPPFLAACLLTMIPFVLIRAGMRPGHEAFRIPYSVSLMYATFSFLGLMGIRILRRVSIEHGQKQILDLSEGMGTRRDQPNRVVLMGAGRAGVMAARELMGRSNATIRVVGFLDDDPSKQGAVIAGIPVLGAMGDINRLAETKQVDEAIITIANAPREQIYRIVHLCEDCHVPTRIIPALHEILSGAVSVATLRPVQIEDLLGREVVHLDVHSINQFVAGKRILVTGAGGSIGSEMVRQLSGFGPSEILLVERCEFALYEINREMSSKNKLARFIPVVADMTDMARMGEVFAQYRPQVVVHAAAYKHVPLMEVNEVEAIRNNTLGTRHLAELAGQRGVEVFVLISTDKAVNPTSVMGATKRLAEIAMQDLCSRYVGTRFVAVRFGNVLGSTGSVIPLFREQIRKGGPVTVTHPDMQRYFMTIPEASQLVLQAASMGQGGEIFVLDMGQPVKIVDLARDMIRLSGLEPDVDIRIEVTGLRPGEKMFEELHTDSENVERTRHPMIFIGKMPTPSTASVESMLTQFATLSQAGDAVGIRQLIQHVLPEANLEDVASRSHSTKTKKE